MRCSIYFLAITYFVICGCATGPVTYQEIEQAVYDTREAYVNCEIGTGAVALAGREMNRAQKRFDTFERNVKKAEIFYAAHGYCEGAWFCSHGTMRKERQNEELHEYVRRYKKDRDSRCRCISRQDAAEVIRAMM